MNSRDLCRCENIRKQLGSVRHPGLYMLNESSTQFVVAELILLKALIDCGDCGIFISIDRPHQYMAHLLRMHGIPHDGLLFLDATSRLSPCNDPPSVIKSFGALDLRGPTDIDRLFTALIQCSINDRRYALPQARFVLMDNISVLLMYNSYEKVEKFLEEFLSPLANDTAVFIVIDQSRNPNLYNAALRLGGVELKLDTKGRETSDTGIIIESSMKTSGVQ